MIVAPVNVFSPESVVVPVPAFIRLMPPDASPIAPENVVVVLSPPTVSVAAVVAPLVTTPAPDSEPIV